MLIKLKVGSGLITNLANKANKMADLIYKELCYKIIGVAFEVHNSLGRD